MHGIPGLLGGLISGIVCAEYAFPSTLTGFTLTSAEYPALTVLQESPYMQGRLQVAGTFTSIGIGIFTGLISGVIIKSFYSFRE